MTIFGIDCIKCIENIFSPTKSDNFLLTIHLKITLVLVLDLKIEKYLYDFGKVA